MTKAAVNDGLWSSRYLAPKGRRARGTSRPGLTDYQPTAVALFLADLLPEVRAAFPDVEAAGGHWVDVEGLGAWPTTASQQEQG